MSLQECLVQKTPRTDTFGSMIRAATERLGSRGLGWSLALIGAVVGCLGSLFDRFEIAGLGIALMLISHLGIRERRRVETSEPDAPADEHGRWTWNLETGVAKSDAIFAAISGVEDFDGTWTFHDLLRRITPVDLSRLHASLARAIEGDEPVDMVVGIRSDRGTTRSVRLVGRAHARDERPDRIDGIATPAAHPVLTEDLAERTNVALERSLAEQARVNAELVEIRRSLESKNRELERARTAAVDATRYKSEFLANMSHEIRTPLGSIVGFADLLDEDLPRDERRGMLLAIRRNSEHLLSLVNDVLDLSRIEADRVELERIPTQVAEVAEDVIHMLRSRADEKGLSLRIEIDDDIPGQVSLDPTRFRQILINLIGNAIKFTERGGVRVRMVYDPGDERIAISIIDTGIGLSPRALERIFEPFRQGDGSTTRRHGGTGLGLHISRRLCELLGGGLSAESVEGRGSNFSATLQAPAIEAPVRATEPTDVLPRGLRVLLAEDGPDNRVLIQHLLGRLGASVESVENGAMAVEILQHRPEDFDVLVLDMQMPVMDGWEAACQLRNAGCAIPILALTANALPGDRSTCLEAGCDGFLTKPIRRRELASGLVEVLAASKAREHRIRLAG